MPTAVSRFLSCADRRIHFLEWGESCEDAVIIWHGVTGSCRDHEDFAERLASEGLYVIAPDSPGCGLSEWAHDKVRESALAFYADVARDLMVQLGLQKVSWVGSSKGGALGIVLSGSENPVEITRLVLNDAGCGLPERFRGGLAEMIGNPPVFPTFEGFEQHIRAFLSKAGLVQTDAGWRRIATAWSRRCDNGSYTFHNDPGLGEQFLNHPEDFDLWNFWRSISAPTLLLRGSHSVVKDEEAEKMALTGPKATIVTRPGGHVTLLDVKSEQDTVLEFLRAA